MPAIGSLSQRIQRREPMTQSVRYAAAMEPLGWDSVVVGGALALVRAHRAPPLIKLSRPTVLDVDALARLLEAHDLERLHVEPWIHTVIQSKDLARRQVTFDPDAAGAWSQTFADLGWSTSEKPKGYTKSHLVDLASGAEGLLPSLPSTTRRNIRRALEEKSVRFEVLLPMDMPRPTWLKVNRAYYDFKGARSYLPDDWPFHRSVALAFGFQARWVLAWEGDELRGGILLVVHDGVGYYETAFSDERGRSLRVPTGLAYEAMKQAIDQRADLFDFVGVWDERRPDRYERWKGFTTFKERFGGESLYFPPALGVQGPSRRSEQAVKATVA